MAASKAAGAGKFKHSLLELVYPPVSNQEAVWIVDDADVEACLRRSDFYMIGGRAEARFLDFDLSDMSVGRLAFSFDIGGHFSDRVVIDIPALFDSDPQADLACEIEAGEKLVRIWNEKQTEVLDWFTTEKLLWDRARRTPGIEGLDRHREAST